MNVTHWKAQVPANTLDREDLHHVGRRIALEKRTELCFRLKKAPRILFPCEIRMHDFEGDDLAAARESAIDARMPARTQQVQQAVAAKGDASVRLRRG